MGLQFLNSIYKRSTFIFDPNKNKKVLGSRDALIYTVKDTETNETTLKIIPEPKVNFYLAKEHQKFHKYAIPKDDVVELTVKFNERDKEIASAVNMKSEFYESFRNGTHYEFTQSMLSHPDVYMADVSIEDFYKTKFMFKYGKNYGLVRKGFMDIEVDISKHVGFPDPSVAPCEINLISFIDDYSKNIYSFILIQNENSDQIKTIMNDTSGFVSRYVDPFIIDKFKLNFIFAKTELELIKEFFNVVHESKLDFIGIWNMNFDMKTIINRLRKLGLDGRAIADIMCHPDVPQEFRFVNYIEDKNRISKVSEKDDEEESDSDEKEETNAFKGKHHPSLFFDWVEIPGYTQFYDQMALFSNLRKRSILPSYKLDDIGAEYGEIKKIDLRSLGYSIKDVNIKNFAVFLQYNIRDTVVQYCIEEKQEDIDKYILFADNTRLSKGVNISFTIKNMIMYFLEENYKMVIGNNINYDVSEKIEGAIVARPELIDELGTMIMNSASYVFNNVIDMDASSEYPTIMIIFNIFKAAIYGRIMQVVDPSGKVISDGKDILKNIQTIDSSIFYLAERYLHLPTPSQILGRIQNELIKNK